MSDFSHILLKKFKQLRDKKGDKMDASEASQLIEELTMTIENHISKSDIQVFKGIQEINNRIEETKREVAETFSEDNVKGASLELDEVVQSTEEATDKILDAIERIQNAVGESGNEELSNKISSDVNEIFEACNFQDLTGQRIQKVTSTLKFIEKAISELMEEFASNKELMTALDEYNQKRKDKIVSGPQMTEEAPSQDDIDKLFDDA